MCVCVCVCATTHNRTSNKRYQCDTGKFFKIEFSPNMHYLPIVAESTALTSMTEASKDV